MYVLADIGGTKTRIAGSSDLASFREPIILDTPASYEAGLALVLKTTRDLASGQSIEAVSLGIPGVIVPEKQVLHDSNMSAWDGKPIVDHLSRELNTKVFAANDTALVGLGEAVHGAGKGAEIVVYMTISTGVNAIRIVHGAIEPSVYGCETGEQYIFVDGTAKHLGSVISGKAISEKYGMHPRDLGKDSPVWEELATYTAYGLYNSIVHWSPHRVVLGGSMMNEIGIPLESIKRNTATLNTKYPALPEIVHSSLGEVGGLFGGLAYLKQCI
jgi:predicted NBD/HSP70 family sugar kinase